MALVAEAGEKLFVNLFLKETAKTMLNLTHNKGFTLIELMIVVAIIAILASIALPSYQQYVVETRRSSGQACLMELSQWMERRYTNTLTYAGSVLPTLACVTDNSSSYSYSLSGNPTQNSYTIQAVPQGDQATKDSGCATLTINQNGTRSRSGSSAMSQCWKG